MNTQKFHPKLIFSENMVFRTFDEVAKNNGRDLNKNLVEFLEPKISIKN